MKKTIFTLFVFFLFVSLGYSQSNPMHKPNNHQKEEVQKSTAPTVEFNLLKKGEKQQELFSGEQNFMQNLKETNLAAYESYLLERNHFRDLILKEQDAETPPTQKAELRAEILKMQTRLGVQ